MTHFCLFFGDQVVWAINSEIQTASLKGLVGDGSEMKDGERLAVIPKVSVGLSCITRLELDLFITY